MIPLKPLTHIVLMQIDPELCRTIKEDAAYYIRDNGNMNNFPTTYYSSRISGDMAVWFDTSAGIIELKVKKELTIKEIIE